MARKTYSKRKGKKLQPAVMNLSFTANSGSGIVGGATNYIDLSWAASIVNRRFYRQGINWSVAGFSVTTNGNTAPGTVTICKAPTTWVTYNAWVKSKAMWDKMNLQVIEANDHDITAKYHDFKVNLNSGMAVAGVQTDIQVPLDGQLLLPTDCSYSLPFTGNAGSGASEWSYSTIQIPTDGGSAPPVEFGLHIVGPDAATKGLITGYADSRSRPINSGEPNTGANGGWMTSLFDLADNLDEIRLDLRSDNDVPPYHVGDDDSAAEFYPGGERQLPGTEVVGYASFGVSVGATGSVTNQRSIKGGMFPCGLVEINSNLTGPAFYDIIVHLVPGHHRGYLCEPMEDV
jgi:hypothetical protein